MTQHLISQLQTIRPEQNVAVHVRGWRTPFIGHISSVSRSCVTLRDLHGRFSALVPVSAITLIEAALG